MNIFNFPVLFKKSNNKLRFWKIFVVEESENLAKIYTEYGTIDGKVSKHKPQIIDKQIGTTSCFKRAINLARTKWKNKKTTDLFYEDDNQNDVQIFKPMKPSNFEKSEKSIIYPAYIQPKLDGFRLFSYNKNGKILTLSRQQKEISHIDAIKNELNIILTKYPNYILDGEIIGENLDLRNLKSILSKKEKENEKISKLKYYIFDLIDKNNLLLTFQERLNILKKIIKNHTLLNIVPTFLVKNKDEVNKYIKKYKEKNYEGIIIRNKKGIYKYNSTSKDVQKVKLYYLDKFKIVDFDEGSGNETGTVIWVVQCLQNPNRTFRVKPKGTREERKEYFKNAKNYIGKYLKVYYFEKDNDGCVIRIKTGEF